ncbi:MAG: 2-oxoacid:acceptor oxidoreductase subunit alpha [Gammaproteobacteria bacterium]|nr:2-oxoacid:acceptor oxidoreductase subunit alpha [Gammaproteobacteria bacterium]
MSSRDPNHPSPTLSVAITGSGGSGVVTAGQMLLMAVADAGLYGLMGRSAGPQIRGGESAVMLRTGDHQIDCLDDHFDILIALDWLNVNRFAEEIPLTPESLIVCDPESGTVPEAIAHQGARVMTLPLNALAKGVTEGRVNMVALGVIAELLGLPRQTMLSVVDKALKRKGAGVIDSAHQCVNIGFDQPKSLQLRSKLPTISVPPPRWNISGNEASGIGALRGGVRFVAAYPITPATEMLEWLAPNLEKLGGALLQAEDELASINMIIGGSFGGIPSLTATSGPGLSLMMEGLGLAVTSETPVVVANVMRGGPSTGIPTKSEQSDLNIALYGFHGDAPHLVLGALDIRDCAFTTEWAVRLSEELQTVAIVLSDQSQGQARSVIDPPPAAPAGHGRKLAQANEGDYLRYRLDPEDGISPMAIPGTEGCLYTADGLEHNERGTPSSMPRDHQRQLDKRLCKLTNFDSGSPWAEIRGTGENCIITWGSSSGAAFEAANRLARLGRATRVIAIRLLSPLPENRLFEALAGATRVLTVEQNHGGQLYHYLHALRLLPDSARMLARPGPLPIRPGEIIQTMLEQY